MTFHDLSEFSMAKVKPFFSRQYQNNHLFNIFSSIIKHKMLEYISTEIKACFWLVCYFFQFLKHLSAISIFLFHDFPWPSLKFHDFPGLEIEITNSMTFQVFHDLYEPWLYKVCVNRLGECVFTSIHFLCRWDLMLQERWKALQEHWKLCILVWCNQNYLFIGFTVKMFFSVQWHCFETLQLLFSMPLVRM